MKLGVLLLNLGGPSSLEDVEPFLVALFSDPDTLPVPFSKWLQKPVAKAMAKLRKPLSQKYYRAIGGGSPLKKITSEQAQDLEEKLNSPHAWGHFEQARVFVGMQYSKPSIEDAWNEIVHSGRTHLVVLPLYPQCSVATTGASIKKLKEVVQKNPYAVKQSLISSWYDHPLYLEALVEKINVAIHTLPKAYVHNFDLVFSAHSLPMKLIEKGDPYEEQTKKTVELILKKCVIPNEPTRGEVRDLTVPSWHLCYQSRTGPIRWLGPSTLATLKNLARQKEKRALIVVPISFVSDHVETHYEIDILYKKEAQKLGFPYFARVESLNTSPKFMAALEDLVVRQIPVIPNEVRDL